jgi:quercetin dioxygenase-like cupin family protein
MVKTSYPAISFFGKESFTPLYFAEDSFAFDWDINPGHKVMEHFHPTVDEMFEVTRGELTFVVKGVEKKLSTGQHLTIPKGVPHEIRNDTKSNSSSRVTYTPAGDQGRFFQVGLFLLKERPDSNGSMSFVFKMMYVSKQMGYDDFSTPATASGKFVFAVLWAPVKLWGDLAGWKRITRRFALQRPGELV